MQRSGIAGFRCGVNGGDLLETKADADSRSVYRPDHKEGGKLSN